MQAGTTHISRRPMSPTGPIIDVETLCGHIALSLNCINLGDFSQGTLPTEEVCFHCRQTARADAERTA